MLAPENVIPERTLLLLSPHYDDVILTWGGLLDGLAKSGALEQKRIRIVHVFSRSCYQARDDEGNRDHSLKRVQFATGIRLLEDLTCLDELMGFGNYEYEIKAERECVLRAKPWKPGEDFEFPQGNQSTFDEEDWRIFRRMCRYAESWLAQSDTAILVPLCVKEHVDHVLVRDAVIETRRKMGQDAGAAVYFGEDQPYTGLADETDAEKARKVVDDLKLKAIDYRADIERKADVLMTCYPSQVEESYKKGVVDRSSQLAGAHCVEHGVERIYRWDV